MRGLANVGNTCGLNTLIQCIGHIRVLREWLLVRQTGDGLTKEFADLLRLLWNDQKSVIPRRFVQIFFDSMPIFTLGEQHDLCELWTMTVNKLGEENHREEHLRTNGLLPARSGDEGYDALTAKAAKDLMQYNKRQACVWTDLLQGVQVSQIQCRHCGYTLHNVEPWATLHLHMHREDANVAQCIERYMQTNTVTDWKCDKCRGQGGSQVVRFWKLPPVLAVTLKRFEYDVQKGDMRRLNQPIHIPEIMEFSPVHVLGPERSSKMRYRLQSMGLHHGASAQGGHYTAMARRENQWFHYDDVQIYGPTEDPTGFLANNREVYMLFYTLDADADAN